MLQDLEIIVPMVVIDETVAKFVERVREEYDRESATTQKLGRLLGEPRDPHQQPIDLAADGAFYRNRLVDRLANEGCHIAEYPSVDHREIVRRELTQKAPFSAKGGYRDYLIWMTLVGRAAKVGAGIEVHLVTANTHDFCKEDRLHPDLAADLSTIGYAGASVLVHSSLDDFNASSLKPKMATVENVSSALAGSDLRGELEELVARDLYFFDGIKLDTSLKFSDERGRTRVRSVKIDDIDVTEGVLLSGGNVWVDLNVAGSATIYIGTLTEDFALQQDAIREHDLEDAEPGEWHWEDEVRFAAHASAILDPSTNKIVEGGVHNATINGVTVEVDQGVSGPW